MPMLAIVRVRNGGGGHFSLWLPLFLIWIVLAPIALVTLPFFALLLAVKRIDPAKVIFAIIGALCSLSGTVIEVESPESKVLVRIQ